MRSIVTYLIVSIHFLFLVIPFSSFASSGAPRIEGIEGVDIAGVGTLSIFPFPRYGIGAHLGVGTPFLFPFYQDGIGLRRGMGIEILFSLLCRG
jgi:hypothetical protein